ncbi:MAG: hypothetical protein IJY42_01895 [Clostridia bacterium]|nr:hypothetical protein [Clostridia bacterium]
MAREVIMKIKAAEAEAANIRATSAEEAKRRVRSAEQRGKALCEQTEEQTLRANREKLELTRQKAEEMVQASREKANADAAAMQAISEKRMHLAVKMIVEGVWEQCR